MTNTEMTRKDTLEYIDAVRYELIENNNVDYATDLFYNDNEEIAEAFKEAIKNTYDVDAAIHKNFVFLTVEDANKDSDFHSVYDRLWDEILMISDEATNMSIDKSLKDASMIQSVFDEQRRLFRIMNDAHKLVEIEYCIESDEFKYNSDDAIVDFVNSHSEDEQDIILSHLSMKLREARDDVERAENELDILFEVDAKKLLAAITTDALDEGIVDDCKRIINAHDIDTKHRNTFSERFAKLDKQHQSDLHELILAMRNL